MIKSSKKNILYIAMSLDGYIAREDGSVDWLYDVEGDGADNGYEAFYENIDTLIMGSRTYEEVCKLSSEFPYAGKPCYVLTNRNRSPQPHVIFTNEDLHSLIPRLTADTRNSDKHVWLVGGGDLVTQLLKEGLLDQLIITIIPKLLGRGIPLFPTGGSPLNLKLTDVTQLGQMVTLTYTCEAAMSASVE